MGPSTSPISRRLKIIGAGACQLFCLPALAQVESVSSRSTFSGSNFVVISTNRNVEVAQKDRLRDLSEANSLPVNPVYAFYPTQNEARQKQLSVVGLRDNDVWQCQLSQAFRQMNRLGRAVESNDTRLNEYKNAVAGANVVLAYEAHTNQAELTAIVQSRNIYYAVKKSNQGSFSIDRLGISDEEN